MSSGSIMKLTVHMIRVGNEQAQPELHVVSDPKSVLGGASNIQSIAVDWVHSKLYFTQSGNSQRSQVKLMQNLCLNDAMKC